MPDAIALSPAAESLLRRHVERGEQPVDDANREAHRELARAGLLVAVHTFTGGREAFYRFTRAGWDFARSTNGERGCEAGGVDDESAPGGLPVGREGPPELSLDTRTSEPSP